MSVTLRPTQAIDHGDVTGGHAPPVGPINLPRTPSQHEGSFEGKKYYRVNWENSWRMIVF